MPQFQLPGWLDRLRWHWTFALVAVAVAVATASDPHLSSIASRTFWSTFRLETFPFKVIAALSLVVLGSSIMLHFALKARNFRNLFLILMVISMQTNGIKLVSLDLVTLLPLLIAALIFAEALRDPSYRIVLPGVAFFALLLMILDFPYFATNAPATFIINYISMFKALIVAFVIVNLLRDERDLDLALRTLVIVAVLSALIGVGQYLFNSYSGLSITLVSDKHETKPTFLGTVVRASALTTWPSWLADFQILALPLLLFRFFNRKTFWARAVYGFIILISLAAVVLTFTYAAYAAVAVIFFIFPFLYWPRRAIHFAVTLLFLGAVFYSFGIFDWVYDNALHKIQTSTGMVQRETYLQATMTQLIRDPWLGSGLYADENLSENFWRKRVHNTGLQAWVAMGLPGLLTFLTMILAVLTQLWILACSSRGGERQVFQSLGLALIGMIVVMFAEPNLTHPIMWFALGLFQSAILVHCTYRYPTPWRTDRYSERFDAPTALR